MMRETTPRLQRIYLRFEDAGQGAMRLSASLTPPAYNEPMMVLLSRGVLPAGQPLSLLLVSDPTQDPALRGPPGKDGDPGQPGKDGVDGASAYQLARQQGYGGTLTQWLASLKGAPAGALLGTVAVGQTATAAIAAGPRRLTLTIPATLGVTAGDSLYLAPTQVVAGYVLHDVVAVSSTSLSIGLTGPLLAIGASFSISCKLFRLNS